MSLVEDMKMVARLAEKYPKEAARLAELSAAMTEERIRADANEYELRWVLGHAREMPVMVRRYGTLGDGDFKDATKADPEDGPCDYVLADCTRLRALLKGELPEERRIRERAG